MYPFPIRKLLVTESVRDDARAAARAERLVLAIGSPPLQVVSPDGLARFEAEWFANRPSALEKRCGAMDYSEGWTVILQTYDGGVRPATFRDAVHEAGEGRVCQSGAEIHCAQGCYHHCAYCHCDPLFRIACDLETLADALPGLFANNPSQRLWKFDNMTDQITLEPEYGASELLVPLFGRTDDRFLLLYTKSDNVEHLLELPHGGHTLISWSLAPPTQARELELNAPDPAARIEAMRRCRQAGYTVRVRLSPIVPVKGWRKEMQQLLDDLFRDVRPDVITIDILGWCHPETVCGFMDVGLLEPKWRETLERLVAEGFRTGGKHLFPHELRADALRFVIEQIRARSPGTPVSICNETHEMWDELGETMGMAPGRYVCCCGPDSVPGNPMLDARG